VGLDGIVVERGKAKITVIGSEFTDNAIRERADKD
jgi:hypothetical protein